MAKVLRIKWGALGTASLMWSSCWRNRVPWSDDGEELPYLMWKTEVTDGVKLTKVLVGPICFMRGKYVG